MAGVHWGGGRNAGGRNSTPPAESHAQAFLEVWGEGDSWDAMREAVAAYPQALKAPYAAEDQV